MEITRDTIIGEVLMDYPEAQEIMLKHFGEQVACVMCPAQAFDTFGMIAEIHGIEDGVVEAMLAEMREAITAAKKEANKHLI
ncbi:MAG: hypothetical protein ACD_43C00269G0008 [uncultured bacterium]|nr:MAG: hypothetical protein ACD_43C00269G0008 [uncultured bacterium]